MSVELPAAGPAVVDVGSDETAGAVAELLGAGVTLTGIWPSAVGVVAPAASVTVADTGGA